MPQKILSINDKKEWNEIVNKLPFKYQDIYLTPEYQSLYLKNNEGDPYCFYFSPRIDDIIMPSLIVKHNVFNFWQ